VLSFNDHYEHITLCYASKIVIQLVIALLVIVVNLNLLFTYSFTASV